MLRNLIVPGSVPRFLTLIMTNNPKPAAIFLAPLVPLALSLLFRACGFVPPGRKPT